MPPLFLFPDSTYVFYLDCSNNQYRRAKKKITNLTMLTGEIMERNYLWRNLKNVREIQTHNSQWTHNSFIQNCTRY